MKSPKANEELYILLSNVDKDFKCDYVLQTAKILAKNNLTIISYYTKPYSWGFLLRNSDKFFNILKSWKKIVVSKKPGIYECEFISLIPLQRFKKIYEINKNLTVYELRLLLFIKKLIVNKKHKTILWVFHANSYFFLKKLGENISLYDCVDSFEEMEQEKKNFLNQEKSLLKKVDLVFANSKALASSKKAIRKDIAIVPCGCALNNFPKRFLPKETPFALKDIKSPIVGLVGYFNQRIDFDLIKYLFCHHKKLSVVFIGSILDNLYLEESIYKGSVANSMMELKKYPGFYWLEKVSRQDLKDYLYFFDVGIIPYDLSIKTVYYSNPMKFYEYLAMGVPVVSTPIPSLLKYKSSFVKFATTNKEFRDAVVSLVNLKEHKSGFRHQAIKIAEENSWEKKVEYIKKQINTALIKTIIQGH